MLQFIILLFELYASAQYRKNIGWEVEELSQNFLVPALVEPTDATQGQH